MEEDYQAPENRIPKWALIAGVVVVFLCLAVLLTLFLARTKLLNVAVSVLATETPTATLTVPATETFTPAPTDTAAPELAPSEAPSATPLPMPPAAITGLSQGGPVLTDGFGDNANSWVGVSQTSEVTIQEQQLQLRSADPGKPGVAFCQGQNCGPYQDFYYVQAQMVEDRPSTLGLGLVFGMNAQKTGFYSFAIRPSSAEYTLYKVANGQWNTLIDWTSSVAIKLYPFVNTVGVSYQDGSIQMFVNGQQVASFTDSSQPYASGRIGFSVESDGVRLLGGNVSVMTLAQVTPAPPAQPAATNQPSAYKSPTPQLGNSPTPTQRGACPAYVPSGSFVLVVFKSGTGKGTIQINGSTVKLNQGNNVFYLPLGKTQLVEIGNKSYEYYTETCKIVSLKLNK